MRIVYATLFVRQFRRLPRAAQERVRSAIEVFATDPHAPALRNHELRGHPGFRSISADENVRIIFRQKNNYAEVIVLDVGGHEVYRRM